MKRNALNALATTTLASLALFVSADVAAEKLPEAKNNSWISLSGTVVSTTPDAFRLDYGAGVVTVEMDDLDFFPEGRALIRIDPVR